MTRPVSIAALGGCLLGLMLSLSACALSGHVTGPRGGKVTVARDPKCGYQIRANEEAGRLVELPALSQIDVGCVTLTKPTEVAALLHAVSPPDDAQQSTCNLIAYAVPVVVGTAQDGSRWSIHIPQTGCGAPKIWSLLERIQQTGHV